MSDQKSTFEKIDEIIANQYNNFKGNIFSSLRPLHDQLRALVGAEAYLAHLEKCKLANPKPVYSIPKEFYNQIT